MAAGDPEVERAKERGFDLLAPIDAAFNGLLMASVHRWAREVVAPGGRLIIGKTNEDCGRSQIADSLRAWGWTDVSEVRRPHAHPEVEISVVWLDRR